MSYCKFKQNDCIRHQLAAAGRHIDIVSSRAFRRWSFFLQWTIMDKYSATYSGIYPYSGLDTAKKPYSDNPWWEPCAVSRARLLRGPFACAKPAGCAAAPASVRRSHGVLSPRTPSPLVFTTPPLPCMTRGKGANDTRRRRTQRNRNGTRCPPPPPSPCENAYDSAEMPPPPPPPPLPPMPRATPGGHRPPLGFCRPAEGGRP